MLLAVSCLGTGAVLLGGRALLRGQPPLTPATPVAALARAQRWSPDPWRRREASLLLHGQARAGLADQRQLLRAQGWGQDPLAAVVLKLDALDAQALERDDLALSLWRQLRRRFPRTPASADALYALGRRQPALRQELLHRFPAHPAALAAALETDSTPQARLGGALHLARWGARWPGAKQRLVQVCRPGVRGPSAPQRAVLAQGLAELGDGAAALACLTPPGSGTTAPDLRHLSTAGRLQLGQSLLRETPQQQLLGEQLLLELVRNAPQSPEAEQAVRLLSQQEGPQVTALLQRLPPRWRDSAPVRARASLSAATATTNSSPAEQGVNGAALRSGLALLRRWPADPASWDLQWDLARLQLLAGRWGDAETLLSAIDSEQLPPPLAARQRFWLGYSQQQQGRDEAATATWRQLRQRLPGGYYGWRAAVQLGEGNLAMTPGLKLPSADWQPLASGDGELDQLWRLDQRTEAWEVWRTRRGGKPPQGSQELLVEGQLRQGVGDDWTGLGQLEQASLRLKPQQCQLLPQLELSLHPLRFLTTFERVANQNALPVSLLLGVAKQESRFTPAVHSAAGAVGLLQLLPSTAAELAGKPKSAAALENPDRNAELGGRYLRNLLKQWQGDPLLAVASYNAGPGAVQGWINPLLKRAPELWVEGIPYPETRLYVKKVLGNAWSYQERPSPHC